MAEMQKIQQMQMQAMAKMQQQQNGGTFKSDQLGIPTPEGEEPFELSQEGMMQMKMTAEMMTKMVLSGTGLAFSKVQGCLTDEQRAMSNEAMAKSAKCATTKEGTLIVQRAMGQVLQSLTAEQRVVYDREVEHYIVEHVPDDTTRCFLLKGVQIRQDELNVLASTTHEQGQERSKRAQEAIAQAQMALMEGANTSNGIPTVEAQEKARAIVEQAQKELDEQLSEKAKAAQEKFAAQVSHALSIELIYAACCLHLCLTMFMYADGANENSAVLPSQATSIDEKAAANDHDVSNAACSTERVQ